MWKYYGILPTVIPHIQEYLDIRLKKHCEKTIVMASGLGISSIPMEINLHITNHHLNSLWLYDLLRTNYFLTDLKFSTKSFMVISKATSFSTAVHNPTSWCTTVIYKSKHRAHGSKPQMFMKQFYQHVEYLRNWIPS